MLSATCPSCSAPLSFPHAAMPAVVCEHCSSTVVREGVDVSAIGKVAPFARDLSPLQRGAKGVYDKRAFEIVGVLRKGRQGVRWNEWAIVFDDGAAGWLAEGNAQWQIFPDPPHEGKAVPPAEKLDAGRGVELVGLRWRVAEVDEARVVAAEGALPAGVINGQVASYADLREVGGTKTATIDYADDPPTLHVGQSVELAELALEGLRAFSGWSDPVLVRFQGPEIKSTRALRCPACQAGLELNAPGQTLTMVCATCGANLSVQDGTDTSTLKLIQQGERNRWKPPLALGKRGELEGLPWEVIGAMTRSVSVDGERFGWTEHLLFNPYRGYRWLIVDAQGHWSLARPLATMPLVTDQRASWGEERFRAFQKGRATTELALGEFTWEVRSGDTADTLDFIAPPHMLSRERSGGEEIWSLGTWLPVSEVEAGFEVKLPAAGGVAPHQLNPFGGPRVGAGVRDTAVLAMIAIVALWIAQSLVSAQETLLTARFIATAAVEDVWLQELTVPDTNRRGLYLELDSDVDRTTAESHLALIHKDSGTAFLPAFDDGDRGTARIASVPPGTYTVRLELSKAPTTLASVANRELKLNVERDVPWRLPLFLAALVIAVGPLLMLIARGNFESRRWMNSDFTG